MSDIKDDLKKAREEADAIDIAARVSDSTPSSPYAEQADFEKKKFDAAVDGKEKLVTYLETLQLDKDDAVYVYNISTKNGKVSFTTWEDGFVGLTTGYSADYNHSKDYLKNMEMPNIVQQADGSWQISNATSFRKPGYASYDNAKENWQFYYPKYAQDYAVLQTISHFIEQNKNNRSAQEYQQCQKNLTRSFGCCINELSQYGMTIDSETGDFVAIKSNNNSKMPNFALNMFIQKQNE